jgi:hypothetical protein
MPLDAMAIAISSTKFLASSRQYSLTLCGYRSSVQRKKVCGSSLMGGLMAPNRGSDGEEGA